MKKEVTITVLAKDVLENSFLNAQECPITRALAIAGQPELIHCGSDICLVKEGADIWKAPQVINQSDEKFNELNKYILEAYRLKNTAPDEIKDYTTTLTLNFPDDEKSS